MSSAEVRAVIFDVGNCLWFAANPPPDADVFETQAAALQPLFESWHIALPRPLASIVADVWAALLEGYAASEERRTYREPSLPFLWRGALASDGIKVTPGQAEEIWRTGWIPVRHFGYQLYPDVIDVLAELKARGFRIGLCTNRPCTEDMLWPDLEEYGLAQFLDAATCSGDTGFFKPHAAPFERALAQLDVAPDAALMVGDSAEADVHGARAVGMRAAWKLNGRYGLPGCDAADATVHDLNELLDLPMLGGRGTMVIASPTPHDDANEDRY